ncbi:unnamed protein product [Camellia sinensis]
MLKSNSDGCSRNRGSGGFGGLLRDERGAWICGYYGRLESCTNLEAELWAVYKGLAIIIQKAFNEVIVKMDAEKVVKLLEEGHGENHPFRGLVEDARIIFNSCQCTAQHVLREGNLCADALAKFEAEQPEGIPDINDPQLKLGNC